MNGATEATLAELLAEAKAMNANLVTLTRLSNSANNAMGSSASNASRNINQMSSSADGASKSLNILATAGNLISSVFQTIGGLIGSLVGGITSTIKGLYNFTLKAAEGTARLSDFYDSFRNLPFGIGMLMGVLGDFQRQTEKLLDTYRNITSTGAAFNGNLALLRTAATQGSLTLDEFARVTRSNSEIFSTMGGNVDRGVMKFSEAQNKLMSRYGGQLLGLGLTAEGAANMLGIFMNNAGRLDRQEMQNNDEIATGVLNMTLQMDAYSKLTGKNREQLEAEMKKKSFDAAWKTFTAGMSPDKAASALAAIEFAIAKGGEGAGDIVKQMFMTGGAISTPITEAGRAFYVQTQGAADEFGSAFHSSVTNMQAGSREQLEVQMEAVRRLGVSYSNFIGPMGDMGAILSLQGNKFVNNTALMNTALVDARRTEAEQRKAIDKVLEQQAKQGTGTAKSAAAAELAVRNFGLTLNTLMNSALAPFIEIAQQFSESFLKYLIPVAKELAGWLGKQLTDIQQAYGRGGFTAAFEQLLKSLGTGIDNVINMFQPTWAKIGPQVTDAMEKTFNFVKPYLVTAFDSLMEFIKPYFERGVRYIFDELKGLIYEFTGGRFGEDKNRSAFRREFDLQQAKIDQVKKDAGANALTEEQVAILAKARGIQYRLADEEKRYMGLSKEQKASYQMPEIRHGGTLGITGNWWEKESANLNVQAGESVVTQDQMRQIVDTASQSGLAEAIKTLNNTTVELVKATKQVVSNTAANVTATKNLNGNLWAT